MDLRWYLNRLRKMNGTEVLKRFKEHLSIYFSRIKYHDPKKWPYRRFALDDCPLVLHSLPGTPLTDDWRHYKVFASEFDLTQPLDWFFSDNGKSPWPGWHYAKINYRPGNPYGDVRINWELNRLQFLPHLSLTDENLARKIIEDWLQGNPYLHGPGYLASMEVALRWISIYRAVCLLKHPMPTSLRQDATGLAVASGKFIESRLSLHSSAGNHLIVEAVGLFWIGKALENSHLGARWIARAREILEEQICRQINQDGSNKEQSFWYLGFVLDAVFHYFLLEDRAKIPTRAWERVEKMIEFVEDMTLPDGSFPDYGDRDDGFVFRLHGNYDDSPFPGLLNIGSLFFEPPDWYRNCTQAMERLTFWDGERVQDVMSVGDSSKRPLTSREPSLRTYYNGGMSLMKWDKGWLLFRHAPLGLENTCGHGHSDALSVLLFWGNVPVLIDLGSGQYNGNQIIRNFFRSTIAHNTIELGGKNQAKILGPFMWDKRYKTNLESATEHPVLFAKASHDGYMEEFSTIHTREVEWLTPPHIEIRDTFCGPGGVPMRGAFHLGPCQNVTQKDTIIEADFGDFLFTITLPLKFAVEILYGSENPFMGWRSTIYGKWEPIHSIVFSTELQRDDRHTISLKITNK